MKRDEVRIRTLEPRDSRILREALYWSIHVAPGEAPPDRALLDAPPFRRFVDRWGRRGDLGLVAESMDGSGGASDLAGAAWVRLLTDREPSYGFLDEATPVLAIAVAPDLRGRGIGTRLLQGLIGSVGDAGYRGISLSVDPDNPARRLYERFGFGEVPAPTRIEGDNHPCMVLRL